MVVERAEGDVSAAAQEYLEAIYNVTMEGDPVVGARLATKFGVSRPSVSEMLGRLERDGYVTLDRRRGAALTERGTLVAEATLRRHRLIEQFLFQSLGMDWIEAHEQADALGHALTPEVEARLSIALGNPTTCPHGNPIPGSALPGREYLRARGAIRLHQAPIGEDLVVVSISEVVEDESALLRAAGAAGLWPGQPVVVDEHLAESTIIRAPGRQIVLAEVLASRVWVAAALSIDEPAASPA